MQVRTCIVAYGWWAVDDGQARRLPLYLGSRHL